MKDDAVTRNILAQMNHHIYEDKHYPRIVSYKGDLSKRWYVEYFLFNKATNDYIKKRVTDMNHYKTAVERMKRCEEVAKNITQMMTMGVTIDKTPPPKPPPPLPSVLELFAAFAEEKAGKLRKNSMKPIISLRNELVSTLGNAQTDLVAFDVQAFLTKLKAKGLKTKTWNNRLATMKEFCAWAEKHLPDYKSPIAGEKLARVMDSEGAVPFSREQIARIKDFLTQNGDEQLLLFVSFIYYTLARPESEILTMQVRDLKEYHIFIPASRSKTKRARNVAIARHFEETIRTARLREYPPHFFIFGEDGTPGTKRIHYRRLYRRHCNMLKEMGLATMGYQLYGYKHTGACELYKATRDLLLVRDQCGHSTATMTEVYLRNLGVVMNERIIDSFPEF